jgi:hypothetical protein
MQRIGLYKPQLLTTLKSNVSVVTTIKASAIAIAVIAIYYQDLNIVFNDALRNEATSLENRGDDLSLIACQMRK